ncbi:MAG: aminoacyl-tRNA deacylase [Streptosporangiaceae bacterium]
MTTPAIRAAEAAGLEHRVFRHGPVASLAEAARIRGMTPADVVKTLVVRRADDDYLFVLVPGDRTISWPKLRALLGVSRLSMPPASTAREVTGYERGTITPLGAHTAWPVIADKRIAGRQISVGAGQHGVAIGAAADDLIAVLNATVADVTDSDAAPAGESAGESAGKYAGESAGEQAAKSSRRRGARP